MHACAMQAAQHKTTQAISHPKFAAPPLCSYCAQSQVPGCGAAGPEENPSHLGTALPHLHTRAHISLCVTHACICTHTVDSNHVYIMQSIRAHMHQHIVSCMASIHVDGESDTVKQQNRMGKSTFSNRRSFPPNSLLPKASKRARRSRRKFSACACQQEIRHIFSANIDSTGPANNALSRSSFHSCLPLSLSLAIYHHVYTIALPCPALPCPALPCLCPACLSPPNNNTSTHLLLRTVGSPKCTAGDLRPTQHGSEQSRQVSLPAAPTLWPSAAPADEKVLRGPQSCHGHAAPASNASTSGHKRYGWRTFLVP